MIGHRGGGLIEAKYAIPTDGCLPLIRLKPTLSNRYQTVLSSCGIGSVLHRRLEYSLSVERENLHGTYTNPRKQKAQP